MRSPERSRRIVATVLLGLVLMFAAVLAGELHARSAIPLELSGEVRSITVKSEHPGIRNAWFVRVDERTRHLDTAIAQRLRVGERVEKDRWEGELLVDGRPLDLGYSAEAEAARWFAPTLVLAAGVLAWLALRRRRPALSRSSRPEPPTRAVGR